MKRGGPDALVNETPAVEGNNMVLKLCAKFMTTINALHTPRAQIIHRGGSLLLNSPHLAI